MKYLKTDEQTMNDLAIFGKPGKQSVYELYHKTITQGGGARLEQVFRYPLSDEELINARAELYQFFSLSEYVFPVDSATIGALAYYLENDDVRSQLSAAGQSISQRLKDMVAADADYVFVHDGVQAGLRLFYMLGQFVGKMGTVAAGSVYAPAFDELAELVRAPEFAVVRQYAVSLLEVKLSVAVLAELDKQIRFEYREKMLVLLGLLYDLDVYMAIGKVARQRGFQFARALPEESGALRYQQVYHPHVEGAIANDLYMNRGQNVLFLTGANMAGKSTLMKSIGIALYLGHMGFPVAAAAFEFAVRDGIYTSINLADNLNAGASHYYAEVLRVKEVAMELQAGRKLFVIFDEMFRGTNVKDAYDATIALTRAFCKQEGSQFIVSTHIMEAGEVLKAEALSMAFQYLPTEMKGSVPVYTRILRDGITADRQGMIIIQNEGILDMLDAGLKDAGYGGDVGEDDTRDDVGPKDTMLDESVEETGSEGTRGGAAGSNGETIKKREGSL